MVSPCCASRGLDVRGLERHELLPSSRCRAQAHHHPGVTRGGQDGHLLHGHHHPLRKAGAGRGQRAQHGRHQGAAGLNSGPRALEDAFHCGRDRARPSPIAPAAVVARGRLAPAGEHSLVSGWGRREREQKVPGTAVERAQSREQRNPRSIAPVEDRRRLLPGFCLACCSWYADTARWPGRPTQGPAAYVCRPAFKPELPLLPSSPASTKIQLPRADPNSHALMCCLLSLGQVAQASRVGERVRDYLSP
ncbi:unnamed protein product [Ectocarpus fasciculatus]